MRSVLVLHFRGTESRILIKISMFCSDASFCESFLGISVRNSELIQSARVNVAGSKMTSGSSLLEPEPTRRPSGSAGIEYVVRTSRDLSREISNFQLDLNSLDPRKVGKRKSKHSVPDKPPQYLRISNCHDFAWSRQLWRDASFRIIGTAIQALLLYVAAAALLAHSDGLRGLDIVYFISACVTTVGLGDISPQSQFHRAASILTLPFGLVILSLCLAADETLKKTYMVPDKEEDEEDGFHGDIASRRKDKSRRHMERYEH